MHQSGLEKTKCMDSFGYNRLWHSGHTLFGSFLNLQTDGGGGVFEISFDLFGDSL